PTPDSPPFPYTTLFRSRARHEHRGSALICHVDGGVKVLFRNGLNACLLSELYDLAQGPRPALRRCWGVGENELSHPSAQSLEHRSEEHTSELQSPYDLV